ncbi:Bardet-Biedl syndrome 7 protein homolog [Anoplophora glabripennis]|uniref:Bardet-Biedl syndrome 7 protein homolog n=1 Tax=Anoplophora glabripennis TaxID=217634 RepID=UPI0008739116|nr:Bardet-Biedl syndrome 7 protein homolog [Anoplophora glabripennis]
MDLELTRVDYTIVGITDLNCLQLLPNVYPKEQQKVAVADSDGILQVFSVKKEDVQLHFKTLPGTAISSLKIAGAPGTIKDKIFIASGNEVRGFTKKGKLFITFDSGMTETISTMFVLASELFLCGKHVYTHYRDCKDLGSYLCGDRIVDVVAFYSQNSRRLMSLIACEGRMIRALEHARVTLSMEVESSPTVLHIYEDEDVKAVLFGTVDGRVGILDVDKVQGFDRWLITNDKNTSTISCMDSYDLIGNGTKNLVIGRQDGSVEVFQVNVLDAMDVSRIIFSYNCNESINGLQCGIVGAQGFDEIVVATYTGRIFGLTSQSIDANVENTKGGYIFSSDTSYKINKLKTEIGELKEKILKEREKYQTSTQSFFDELSAIPLLSIKDSFVLEKATSTYNLSIEVPTPIDNILLQCNTNVDLLDVEKNSAVVSYSESRIEDGNHLLATYRCQMNTNRIELKIRTIEGQKGLLQAYVTPMVQPKCCRVAHYEIKALSLHCRIHQFDSNRPFNVLTIKGGFSLAEIHSWVGQCLPEVPEKPQISERTILWFKSCFLDTVLECSYLKGDAEFKSDNVSTISILKENISAEATKKKIKVDINSFISEESINSVLKLLENKLLLYQKIAKEVSLLNALNELEVSEEETTKYLSSKYKDLLEREKDIRTAHQNQPGCLDRIYGTITDLFMDFNKFKGINSRHKAPKLVEILESYSYDNLVKFFRPDYV